MKAKHVNELYDIIGDKTLQNLVNSFYSKIENDQLLRPMFPPNLTFGKNLQYLFLKQVFGGPREYNEKRGHPMMRKRHLPFEIGWQERNHWMELMKESVNELDINNDNKRLMIEYFDKMATKIMNKVEKSTYSFNLS